MGKPAEGVLGSDGGEGGGDGGEQVRVVAGLGLAKEGLHFAPHQLDGVEVGRVGGKESDFGADGFDQGQSALVFMGAEENKRGLADFC